MRTIVISEKGTEGVNVRSLAANAAGDER